METTAKDEPSPAFGKELWKLLPFARPYKKRIAVGIAANAFARLFDLLPMILVGMLIDDVAGGDMQTRDFVMYGLAVLGTFVGLAIFQSLSDYCWDTVAQMMRHDLRLSLYAHLQSLDVSYFEERQAGDIMSVVQADVDNLENFLADATTSMIRLVITFVGIYGFLLWLDWRLALLLFAPLPIGIAAVRFFVRRVQPQYRKGREAVGSMNAILQNNLQGIGVIQAYTAQDHQLRRITKESEEYRDAAVGAAGSRARFIPVLYAIAGAAFSLLIAVGGWLAFTGRGPSVGDYVTFVLFAMRLIMPLFILGVLLNQLQRSEASARRIRDLLREQPRVKDAPDARPLSKPPESIEFQDVHFQYPGRETKVLHGTNVALRRGQVLGVVGPTGAGKSTILKLLLRYYDPVQGHVRIDGQDLKGLQVDSFRRHVGYVSQEPFLFSGTVKENIALGAPDASDMDVREASRIAGADEFIAALPQGYDTLIGERGLKLSGGQRQRISLARAVLRKPALLVLDEATSAVDTRTEELIQRNLHEFRTGRMTLAVAHRLSTVRQADIILVVVDGVVVERGSHDELVANGGVYADLWRVQSGEKTRVSETVPGALPAAAARAT